MTSLVFVVMYSALITAAVILLACLAGTIRYSTQDRIQSPQNRREPGLI